MPRKLGTLVAFNAPFYAYPESVYRGYWARWPSSAGMRNEERQRREAWLNEVRRKCKTEFHSLVMENYCDPGDVALLLQLATRHGVYIERFFLRRIRARIVECFVSGKHTAVDIQKAVSAALGYKAHCPDTREACRLIADHIYEQTLCGQLTHGELETAIAEWYERFSVDSECALCGRRFRIIDLPDWVYFGSAGCRKCCFTCPIIERPSKKMIAERVAAFVREVGFVPGSDAGPINFSFTSRLGDEDHWLRALGAYARMGGIEYAAALAGGTWFKALATSGVLPEGVLATARGVRCISKDGHECNSLDEQRIDDWLFAHGIEHEKEPTYPVHATLNSDGRKRADWRIANVYVEYFGLRGDKTYDARTEEKIELAAAMGVRLVAVYPEDVEFLERCLGRFCR